MDGQKHSLVLAVVRKGFSDRAMNAARDAGATGGTIINARGTGSIEIGKFLGVAIEPEKELLLILTKKELRQEIMCAIYKVAGLTTEGNGLAFALPVDSVMGVTPLPTAEPKKDE